MVASIYIAKGINKYQHNKRRSETLNYKKKNKNKNQEKYPVIYVEGAF